MYTQWQVWNLKSNTYFQFHHTEEINDNNVLNSKYTLSTLLNKQTFLFVLKDISTISCFVFN